VIVILNYGMGNLRSVQKALEKVGFQALITHDPDDILAARGVVLPGVGAFANAMANLKQVNLIGVLQQVVAMRKPLLGICLGLQLLLSSSEEDGWHPGLDFIPGTVKRLPKRVKVPHMGWNQINIQRENPLLQGIPKQTFYYFVHSYYVQPDDPNCIDAFTTYDVTFPSVISNDRVFGMQFHPEKSHDLGLRILKNFGELVKKC